LQALHPVAAAADVEHDGVVDQPVNDGGGGNRLMEDLVPVRETAVGSQDDRAFLVATADDVVHPGRGGTVERHVPELIDDEKRRPDVEVSADTAEGRRPSIMGGLKVSHHVGGGHELDAIARLQGAQAEANGQVRFANAGWSDEDDVAVLLDEPQRREFGDQLPVDAGLKVEVEIVEALADGELRGPDPRAEPSRLRSGDLVRKEALQDQRGRELLAAALIQLVLQPLRRRVELEIAQVGEEPLVRLGATRPLAPASAGGRRSRSWVPSQRQLLS
jgi:hypothetical protein